MFVHSKYKPILSGQEPFLFLETSILNLLPFRKSPRVLDKKSIKIIYKGMKIKVLLKFQLSSFSSIAASGYHSIYSSRESTANKNKVLLLGRSEKIGKSIRVVCDR